MTAAQYYTLTLPSSGIGPMTFSLAGDNKSTGRVRRFAPAHSEAEEEPSDTGQATTAPEVPASSSASPYKPDPTRRRVHRRKTTLDKLLFNIVPPPPMEAFFWFDSNRMKWTRKDVEDVLGGTIPEWRMKLNGKKPDLQKLRNKLVNRLERRYPEGYFLYRWKLEFGSYGEPVLHLHLIGDPGPGHTMEAVTEHLTAAWFALTDSTPDSHSLIRVQPTHRASRGNFSKPLDVRLASDLERLLDDSNEFGRVSIANIPWKAPLKLNVADTPLKTVLRIILENFVEYEGLRGAADGRAWNTWGRAKFLRMLSDGNFGNVFLNEVTGPLVRKVLGVEEPGS